MKLSKPSMDIGIVASDIEASMRFYCEDLGLEKVSESTLPGNRTLHRLQCGDGLVKLQEYHDGAPDAGPPGIPAQAGIRYFTLWVSDLPAEAERLAARGVKFTRPLGQSPSGSYSAMIEDPDGNTIEFIDDSGVTGS